MKKLVQPCDYKSYLLSTIDLAIASNKTYCDSVCAILDDAQNKGYLSSAPINTNRNFALYDSSGNWIGKFKVICTSNRMNLTGGIKIVLACKDGQRPYQISSKLSQFRSAFSIPNTLGPDNYNGRHEFSFSYNLAVATPMIISVL